MEIKQLFTVALGLKNSGWYIDKIDVDESNESIALELKYRKSLKLKCPECGAVNNGHIYDHSKRQWRHKDFYEYATVLKAEVPRIHCNKCGKVSMINVPWSNKMMRITFGLERLLVNACILMPISDVCKLYRVSYYTVVKALERKVNEFRDAKRYDSVTVLGFDEIAMKKGHEYLTIVYDLIKSEVIWIGRNRGYTTVKQFVEWFGLERFKSVETICCDMWDPFIKAILEYHDRSKIVFDKFHIKKHLNEAVDKVRKIENRELSKEGNFDLKSTKYIWLKNPGNLTANQQITFGELRKKKYKSLKAYEYKELFNKFWAYAYEGCAERFFKDWYQSVTHSNLQPMIRVAKMIKRYFYGVISYVKRPVTNARSEGINTKIRVFTRRAFGYKTYDMLKNMIFLGCGGLNINPFKSN